MKRAILIVLDSAEAEPEWQTMIDEMRRDVAREAPGTHGVRMYTLEACAAGELEQEAKDRTEPCEGGTRWRCPSCPCTS